MKITFKSFLNETAMKSTGPLSQEEFIAGVKEKCQPFLKDMGKRMINDDIFVFRGFTSHSGDYIHGTVRTNREPKDTNRAFHELFNNWTKEKFGIYSRSECLFATSDEGEASEYGSVFAVFPTGPYEEIYSSVISDLYDQLLSNPSKLIMNFHKFNERRFADVLEEYHLITDEDKDWESDHSVRYEFQTFRSAYDSTRFGFQGKASDEDMDNLRKFMVKEVFEKVGYVKEASCKRAAGTGTEMMIHCKEYYAVSPDEFGEHGDLVEIIKKVMQ